MGYHRLDQITWRGYIYICIQIYIHIYICIHTDDIYNHLPAVLRYQGFWPIAKEDQPVVCMYTYMYNIHIHIHIHCLRIYGKLILWPLLIYHRLIHVEFMNRSKICPVNLGWRSTSPFTVSSQINQVNQDVPLALRRMGITLITTKKLDFMGKNWVSCQFCYEI